MTRAPTKPRENTRTSTTLVGGLQIRLPCVHRYFEHRISFRAPEIARIEAHGIEPLRILPLPQRVRVRENMTAAQPLDDADAASYVAGQPCVRRRMNVLCPNA